MSKLVCHVMKFGKSDLKGMQVHNQREREQTVKNNPDIDPERTKLNYDLHTGNEDINYNLAVKNRLEAKYEGEKAIRKDAKVMVGVLVSSDREFFANLPPDRQREFFQQAYDYVAERYGKENIVSARVHMDETTPHMHLNLVPLTNDGRLCAKELFDRANLLRLQQELPERLKQSGFEIEKGEGRNFHKDTLEWKREQVEKNRLQLESQEKELSAKKAALDRDADRLEKSTEFWHKLKDFEQKKIEETRGKFFGSDTVKLPINDFRTLCEYARAGANQDRNLSEAREKVERLESIAKNNAERIKLGSQVMELQRDPKFKLAFDEAAKRQEVERQKAALERKNAQKQGLSRKLGDDEKEKGLRLK